MELRHAHGGGAWVSAALSGLGWRAGIYTGVALSLHPGLGSASPSGLLLAIMTGEQTADALHYELCYVHL